MLVDAAVEDVEPISVLFMCEKAPEVLRGQAEEKGISFEVDVSGHLPDVAADLNKVTWGLNNLLSNALRYSEPGDHVQIDANTIGEFVHISVADEGTGIPYEHQSKIFDTFVKVDGDRSPSGTGLGLAISQEIIHAHGGHSGWTRRREREARSPSPCRSLTARRQAKPCNRRPSASSSVPRNVFSVPLAGAR